MEEPSVDSVQADMKKVLAALFLDPAAELDLGPQVGVGLADLRKMLHDRTQGEEAKTACGLVLLDDSARKFEIGFKEFCGWKLGIGEAIGKQNVVLTIRVKLGFERRDFFPGHGNDGALRSLSSHDRATNQTMGTKENEISEGGHSSEVAKRVHRVKDHFALQNWFALVGGLSYLFSRMKTVILCGGLGTRLAEETGLKPKPMVEIGGHPILWHVMNIYAAQGFKEFTLALGYKANLIKEYFLNYAALNCDFRVSLANGKVEPFHAPRLDWLVDLIDTGADTLTGGRLLRLEKNLRSGGTFMLTYGDGVANVNVKKLVEFHKSHGKVATVTAVRPSARFGGLRIEGNQVAQFQEKPQSGEGWINGGFFVFEPKIFDYLKDDKTILERDPMEGLVRDGQLMTYRHEDFWQCMDTVRDRDLLQSEWASGRAPWKIWKDPS